MTTTIKPIRHPGSAPDFGQRHTVWPNGVDYRAN
jgi:hypothetical protein